MTSIKEIRRNISSLQRLHTITKAMEAVSITKMKRAQDRAGANAAYFRSLLRITTNYLDAFSSYLSEREEERREGKVCLLLVTSDKGLVGNLNAETVRHAQPFLDEHPDADSICIGRKGYEHLRRQQRSVSFHRINVSDHVSLEDLEDVADHITEQYTSGAVSHVSMIFQHFVSTFTQQPTTIQILPLNHQQVIDNLKKTVFHNNESEDMGAAQYTVEPDLNRIFDRLFSLLMKVSVYSALVENKASEHSARMIAMKNARDTSEEMIQKKHLLLNKQRQTAITNEVLESLGGMQALGV
ncbi:MAG: ATP synthase F1 subunit gamma [Candidatus Kaiserbacteria bacterium]|nr:ATP synthase F1 subunit gamma [Candidatus Kaiserbacteria bacterium]